MNYSPIFTIAARTETAYTAAQDWIRNDAPVLEQRLKTAALSTAVSVLEFALTIIDWLSAQLKKTDEYRLIVALGYIQGKRFAVRQLIKLAQLNQHYKFTATLRRLWHIKGCIAQNILDTIFCLHEDEQLDQSQFSE